MRIFNRRPPSSDEKHPDGPPDPPPSVTQDPPPPAYGSVSSEPDLKTAILQLPPTPSALQPQSHFGSSAASSSTQTTFTPPARGTGPLARPPAAYAALLISSWDKIRIIGFPKEITGVVDAVIRRDWAAGVQSCTAYELASQDWKLVGKPFYGQFSQAIPARRLLAHLLQALLENGWRLSTSTDLNRKDYVKDTLVFRSTAPAKRYVFPVSFNESDKIRLIDASSEQVKVAFELAVRGAWPQGLQEVKQKETRTLELKLNGRPWWTSSGDDVTHSRMVALAILGAMETEGFELLGRVAVSKSLGEDLSEMDTWFFVSMYGPT